MQTSNKKDCKCGILDSNRNCPYHFPITSKPFVPAENPMEESLHNPCTYGNDDCPKCHSSPQQKDCEHKIKMTICQLYCRECGTNIAEEKITKESDTEWSYKINEQKELKLPKASTKLDINDFAPLATLDDMKKNFNF